MERERERELRRGLESPSLRNNNSNNNDNSSNNNNDNSSSNNNSEAWEAQA